MKGIGFVNARNFVVEQVGLPAWARVLAALHESDRAEVESAVAVGWYDTYLFARLLRTIDTECGKGDLTLLTKLGGYEAERDFNRALRVLLRVVAPQYVFTTHQRLWSHFQNTGSWTIEAKHNCVIGTLRGWAVDRVLCVELSGYLSRLLEFTGGTNVTVEHARCRARRSEQCVFQFRWT